MHLRGRYQILEAVYPDSRWEVINKFDFDHNWQTAFLYEDDVMPLFPKGTVLIVTGVFDNTAGNPHNPDPDQWVVRGDRTSDSMCHFRMGLTYFDDQEEFERVVREREELQAKQLAAEEQGGGGESEKRRRESDETGYFLTVGVLAVQVLAEGTIPLRAQTNIPGTADRRWFEIFVRLRSAGDPAF